MESVLIAAMLAAVNLSASNEAPAEAAMLDRACFRLMAELAEDEDPRLRMTGRIAAQYFLGRIDAASPDFDPDALEEREVGGDRDGLLRRCGDALQAGGRDFRSIGRALAPAPRPAV
jgi:hypothetical protein